MSLLEFPPLNSAGKPYVLQEYNGRLLTGNIEEFRRMAKCDSMADYPFVERAHLNSLQHSISKSDVADTYVFREADPLKQAMDRWEKDGITGVIDHVSKITEDSKLWPISRLGRGVLRVQNGFANIAARVLPSMGQDRIEELLHEYSSTMNWKNNWLRCVAAHDEGRRLALCQNNNYIRIYNIGRNQKTPLTLKHPLQNNVACMAWEPFDHRVLAVAANNKILIWRLSVKATNIKPSVRCAQVVELPATPISQIVWDRTTSNVILAVSPNSSKIMIVDISTGEVDCFGAWTGGNVTRIVPTLDGRRFAVLYTGNVIRVYDRSTWHEERWSGLAGRAVSAVWSPAGDSLLFASEESYQLYTISFVTKNVLNEDGITEARWTGDTRAVSIFDVSPVEFDPSELEVEGAVEREIVHIGGRVHALTLSPDGQRLAVSFKENPPVVALFIVDWLPIARLTPSGFVEAPLYGHPSILFFLPKFSNGSMLSIVWSSGNLQYLPLLYGHNTSSHFTAGSILDELSGHSSPAHRITSDSLRSSELPITPFHSRG
ncbi:unnamed protein product [Haemonchus placei]|uniref:ANAPC4_WD40 domain-containing protein n=2 Tax=Haemonchus placei TaxID=6290 RepID=A0A0N4WU53_HAEPC|nr:unnamed protein product [Haemonchus placei]